VLFAHRPSTPRSLRKINANTEELDRSRGSLGCVGTGLVSPGHIVVLVAVLLLIFGPARLPEIGRSLGKGIREFRDSATAAQSDPEHTPDAIPAAPAREHDTP
jgi:sec-independent protein translocase protein TatA